MTNAEAIETLRANYPDACFEQLREAVDAAIEALKARDAGVGRLVRCEDCRYGYQFYDVQNGVKDSWIECRNPDGLNRDVPEDGYCYCGKWKDDPSHPFADDVMMGGGGYDE